MAKVRVYELAKEFGVESKAVMAKLQEMGEFVRSASSTIEAPVVRRLTEAFAAQSAKQAKEPARAAQRAQRPQAAPVPAGQPSGQPDGQQDGQDRVEQGQRRDAPRPAAPGLPGAAPPPSRSRAFLPHLVRGLRRPACLAFPQSRKAGPPTGVALRSARPMARMVLSGPPPHRRRLPRRPPCPLCRPRRRSRRSRRRHRRHPRSPPPRRRDRVRHRRGLAPRSRARPSRLRPGQEAGQAAGPEVAPASGQGPGPATIRSVPRRRAWARRAPHRRKARQAPLPRAPPHLALRRLAPGRVQARRGQA